MSSPGAKTYAHQPPQITILSDHPARDRGEDGGMTDAEYLADKDLLRLQSRLSPVFDILRHKNTRSPLTIAIYGTWGTGKTSAMRWLETRLKEWNSPDNKLRDGHPKVHPIWFDPWRYHTKEDVWRGIISEVILALFTVGQADRETLFPRLMQAAKQFGGFLGRGFLHALASIDAEFEPQIAGTKVGKVKFKGEAVRTIWEEYEKTNHPEKAYLNQFEDTLREWVSAFLPKHEDGTDQERIAIFIDDLDRCLPDVTLEVLEALKLYLNIPSLIFVVGLDREVVDAVVQNQYRKNEIPVEKARSYLDKIFQVDLTIPPSQTQMQGFLEAQIQALNTATSGYWHEQLTLCSQEERVHAAIQELSQHNPREIKRLLNSALICGRNAAQDEVLDKTLGVEPEDRAERFASGVQVFLLQRLVRSRLTGCDNLLIDKRNSQWFELVSKIQRWVVEAENSAVKDGKGFVEALASTTGDEIQIRFGTENGEITMPQPEALAQRSLKKMWETLRYTAPARDDGSAIGQEFWEQPLLWDILLIPFKAAIAQNAPNLESRVKATPTSAIDLTSLSPLMREGLASEAGVPLDSLTPEHLGRVVKLKLKGSPLSSSDLNRLSQFPQLQELHLSDPQLSDISPLAGLTQLQRLYLQNTSVCDLNPLTDLIGLRHLSLQGRDIANVAPLAKLSQLRELDLGGTQVSDVKPLGGLLRLRALDLQNTRVTNVSALSSLGRLQTLDLSNTVVSDIRPLTCLVQLRVLHLTGTPVADVSDLSFVKELRQLHIGGRLVSDAQLDALKEDLPELKIIRYPLPTLRYSDQGSAPSR